jgi:hypothetical protein
VRVGFAEPVKGNLVASGRVGRNPDPSLFFHKKVYFSDRVGYKQMVFYVYICLAILGLVLFALGPYLYSWFAIDSRDRNPAGFLMAVWQDVSDFVSRTVRDTKKR